MAIYIKPQTKATCIASLFKTFSTMYTAKRVTPKALSIKLHEQQDHGTNMNKRCSSVGESSFRVLYYGASKGSVPFMWESQPGTPKHALTDQSSLPPLTPPPSYQSMQMIKTNINHSSKRSSSSGFLRTMFKKRNNTSSFSSSSVSSSSSYSSLSMSLSMHMQSAQSTPMSKTEVRRMMKYGLVDDGDHTGSPTSTLCMGGGFKKGCRFMKVKKAMLSFVRPSW